VQTVGGVRAKDGRPHELTLPRAATPCGGALEKREEASEKAAQRFPEGGRPLAGFWLLSIPSPVVTGPVGGLVGACPCAPDGNDSFLKDFLGKGAVAFGTRWGVDGV
jgi:hypothetical protein